HVVVIAGLLGQRTLGYVTRGGGVGRAQARPRAASFATGAAREGVRVAGTIPNPVGGYSYTEDEPRQHVSLEQSFDWLLTRGADRGAAQSGVLRAQADSVQAAAAVAAETRRAF